MTRILLVLLFTVLLTGTLAACGASPPREESVVPTRVEALPPLPPAPSGKLPAGVVPLSYVLDLRVDPRQSRFSGEVVVRAELAEATRHLWMHGKHLEVESVRWQSPDGRTVTGRWEPSDQPGVVAVVFPQLLAAEEGELYLRYSAPFGEDLDGLYRVQLGDDAYAFTQLESIAARKMFPSFDEPRFKTPFSLSLTVPQGMQALANTPAVEEQDLPSEERRVRFAPTRPLPTYLIAIAVGPLDVVDGGELQATAIRDRSVKLRGVAARGKGQELAYALSQTERILSWLEEYFGHPYPYQKLDIVAVPDFSSGAMENVGLVTFREWLLLFDPETASESQKRAYAYVMAHELAHMWFGNWVTMPWWDDIWLNEAFATWMGNKAVRALYPDYDAELSLLVESHGAMGADSLASARRIRQPIESNHDIRNAFDAITYEKGAAVLEMVEQWLGPEPFRARISEHLGRFRDGHATAEDLIASLSAGEERPVQEVFHSFLYQPGVPLLNTELRCEDGKAEVTFSQERYLPLGSTIALGETPPVWNLPVCVRVPERRASVSEPFCVVLQQPSGSLELPAVRTRRCPRWVHPNADGNGYYRFALSPTLLQGLLRGGFSRLTSRERLSLADSVQGAFSAGRVALADLLPELTPLIRAPEQEVLRVPIRIVSFLHDHVVTEEAEREALRVWATPQFRAAQRQLRRFRRGEGTPQQRLVERRLVQFFSTVLRDEPTRERLTQLAFAYLGVGEDGAIHPEAMSPELVRTALSVAAEDGDARFFDVLLTHLHASQDATLRSRLIAALGSFRDPMLAERARGVCLAPELRSNERLTVLSQQLGEPATQDAAWRWLKANFATLAPQLSPARRGQLPWYVASFCSGDAAGEVEAFFAPKVETLDGGPRNLSGAVEAIRLCAARAAHYQEQATAFFGH